MDLSFWEKTSFFENIDIIIVGSGIVGLSTAMQIKLKSPNLQVLVIDRGFLPYGASTRNAGFACIGSMTELLDDIAKEGEEIAFLRVEKRFKGLQLLIKILGEKNINFQKFGGFELFTTQDIKAFNNCKNKLDSINNELHGLLGIKNTFSLKNKKIKEFGFKRVDQLILNKVEGQIDTGMMMSRLTQKCNQLGVKIINGLDVTHYNKINSGIEIFTDKSFSIKSKKLIICNNGFAKELLSQLDVEPARAQVLMTAPIPNLKIKGTFHYEQGYYYFRNVGNRILLGGGRNLDFKGENTSEFGLTDLIQQRLELLLKEVIIPDTRYTIDYRWSGIMGIGSSKTSIVKNIEPDVICAVRMGGMGVAIGSIIGEEAADLVLRQL
jgi:gamma-glutamylputrescine oxidase